MDDALRLRTARFDLVPLALEHVPALYALMSDARVTEFLAWEPHAGETETRSVVESLIAAQTSGHGYHWVVIEDGIVRGLVSLIDVRRTHRAWTLDRAEVAYWIDPQRQGKGVATEATEAVVQCAFAQLGLNRLRISHTSANPASGRVPQKLGFRFVGTERQFFKKNDTWYDMNHYEMLAADWTERRR